MQIFRMKRWMIGGAVACSLALGTTGALGLHDAATVFALDDDTELDGVVEMMPESGMIGTWQIGGKTILVTEATALDQEMGPLAVGAAVEVEGEAQPDGSILASEIEVEDLR